MNDKGVLDETLENLKEAGQRIRASQGRIRAQRMVEVEVNRELVARLDMAMAAVEAAYIEAKRRREM